MVDFRKRLLGLAAVTLFTGTMYGQINCIGAGTGGNVVPTGGASFIRAEGQTELLPQIVINCTNSGVAATASIQVGLTPAVSSTPIVITSAVTNTSTGATEAIVTADGGDGVFNGVVSGNTLTFTGVTMSAGTTHLTLNNIRVNATSVPLTGGLPSSITATAFIQAPTNMTVGSTGASTVAYVAPGLANSKIYYDPARATAGSTNIVKPGFATAVSTAFGVCGGINTSTTAVPPVSFYVGVDEGASFVSSFKTQIHEASGVGSDVAASGTRIKIVFSNVPTGLNIYLPLTQTATTANGLVVAVGDGAILTAVTNEIGAQVAQTAATTPAQIPLITAANGASAGTYLVSVSGGTATAIYEVTTDNPNVADSFTIPVFLQAGTNTLGVQSTTMMVSTSFAPITAATTIPSFAVGTSTAAVPALNVSACTTSLLFPFVTNANGFETGLAIDNTSKDPFGTKTQSGICTLYFYPSSSTGAPTSGQAPNPNPGEGAAAPYLAGESYAFTLTSALAAISPTTPTFSGYMIAQCQFSYAHGFAYILYGNLGASTADTMGYVATTLTRGTSSLEVTGQ